MSSNFQFSNDGVNSSLTDTAILGAISIRSDIASSLGPFSIFPDYKVQYPEVITRALGEIYQEYNEAFASLRERNKEWGSDYQFTDLNNSPVNWMVQIDMAGLSKEFLQEAHQMSKAELKLCLRKKIFEIENSVAMYSLLQECFSNGHPSFFKNGFQKSLDELRARFNMPIALLAVTDEKYQAMKATEFGKNTDEGLSDKEVKQISGFDRFFGPGGFIKHLRSTGGKCEYLLYVRSSDPGRKLKDPTLVIEHPLLNDSEIRQVIKEHSVTINVDNPAWIGDDLRRVNDTKLYMPAMNMGFFLPNESFFWNREFARHISVRRSRYRDFEGERLSKDFKNFLTAQGVDPKDVENGLVSLRAKPSLAAFGCYGHHRGQLNNAEFRKELRRLIRNRGGYIIQPEVPVSQSIDLESGIQYEYIDRNFFSVTSGEPVFIGGVRNFTMIYSSESLSGRGHGNSSSVFAEITA